MESLVKKGLTKSIGVSNYNAQLILDILSYCEIKPAVNMIEFHPYFDQTPLLQFCRDKGIHVIAYSSICRSSYVTNNTTHTVDLLDEKVITEMAKKHGKSPGQIALNYALAQGVGVIPGTSKVTRMVDNMGSLDFRLSADDLKEISSLNKSIRFVTVELIDMFLPGMKHDNIFA